MVLQKYVALICFGVVIITFGCKRQTRSSYDVTTYPGANAGEQLNACLTTAAQKGGICDATGYGATTQTIAATVRVGVWPDVTGPQRLTFSQATTFQASNNVQMFLLGPYATVDGLRVDVTNQPNYASSVITIAGYLALGDSTMVAANLHDFVIIGNTTATGSVGIELTTPPDGTKSTYFATVSNGSIGGFRNDILLYAPSTSVGGVNANSFSHLKLGKSVYTIELNGASGFNAPALQLSGNSFVDISAQAKTGLTLSHLYIHGAASGNTFLAMQLFDVQPTILTVSDGSSSQQTGVYSNYFQGWIYPIKDNAQYGNTASHNLWDCVNCAGNESKRNTIMTNSMIVGAK